MFFRNRHTRVVNDPRPSISSARVTCNVRISRFNHIAIHIQSRFTAYKICIILLLGRARDPARGYYNTTRSNKIIYRIVYMTSQHCNYSKSKFFVRRQTYRNLHYIHIRTYINNTRYRDGKTCIRM